MAITPDAAGTHLTPFDRAVGRYIMAQRGSKLTTLADLATTTVRHESAYQTDLTWWPAETIIEYTKYGQPNKTTGVRQAGTRVFGSYCGETDAGDLLRLFLDKYADGVYEEPNA